MAGKEASARTMEEPGDAPDESPTAGEGARPKSLVGRLKVLSRLQLVLIGATLAVVLGLATALLVGAFDPLLIRLGLMSEPVDDKTYSGPPVYVDVPDLLVNLAIPDDDVRMLKTGITLELFSPADKAVIKDLMPRIQDALQTRLRALTPDDLKGTAQTYRLRRELLQRIRVAVGPEHVKQLFFRELLTR